MRKLFFFSSALFWLAILVAWAASNRAPENSAGGLAGAGRRIGLDEVARHAGAEDCWMAINGAVYAISSYIPDHPSNPRIVLPWCGKEATEAYRTKTRGRPHSAEADSLLEKYRIGVVEKMPR